MHVREEFSIGISERVQGYAPEPRHWVAQGKVYDLIPLLGEKKVKIDANNSEQRIVHLEGGRDRLFNAPLDGLKVDDKKLKVVGFTLRDSDGLIEIVADDFTIRSGSTPGLIGGPYNYSAGIRGYVEIRNMDGAARLVSSAVKVITSFYHVPDPRVEGIVRIAKGLKMGSGRKS